MSNKHLQELVGYRLHQSSETLQEMVKFSQ